MKVPDSEKQELLRKLNELLRKQSMFQQEINELQRQIIRLTVNAPQPRETVQEETKVGDMHAPSAGSVKETVKTPPFPVDRKTRETPGFWQKSEFGSELEQFIGTNLINKVGMIVVIIGVGIGVKYAIDNDLISPLVRIILGYLLGLGLAAFAIRLKPKYLNFSAVLFSGSMAIHYFITYAASSYYALFPQIVSIILMVLITILTVALALYYNQQVIAHFGLVGAYIIPYILKEPFQNASILFIYMAIINSGILFLSTKKRWKYLNYLAFLATWIIFITWFNIEYSIAERGICLVFLTLFFSIFYLVLLSYKLILKESLQIADILFLLINAGILYIIGYIVLNSLETTKEYLGLFTLANGAFHGLTTYLVAKKLKSDSTLFFWTSGLAILFLTLTISVQFNNQVTSILWSVETALLFLYAKSKRIMVYEIFTYALIGFTTLVTITNWGATTYNMYGDEIQQLYLPVFNIPFLASFVVLLSFLFIHFVNSISKPTEEKQSATSGLIEIIIPLLMLFILYFSLFTQITLHWSNVQVHTSFELTNEGIWHHLSKPLNPDIEFFMHNWLMIYTMLFAAVLNFANFRWFRSKNLGALLLVANYIVILIFLTAGLSASSHLLDSYVSSGPSFNNHAGWYYIGIRYISLAFFALLLYTCYQYVNVWFASDVLVRILEVVLCISIVWVGSTELISWLKLGDVTELYKHQLSILWGVFSLILIIYGIWKKKKYIRITSMVLIGITLIKLFFYDLTNLKTIPKTIVFVSIGILFLIISFLYNKYRKVIFPEQIH